jgi:hypothetical protein
MYDTAAFAPLYTRSNQDPAVTGTLQPSTTVAATDASSASAKFAGSDRNSSTQIQIANTSTSWAYVNFGVFGAVAAATVASSYPVAPGTVVVVTVDPEVSGVTIILGTAAATGNVIFTRGQGL